MIYLTLAAIKFAQVEAIPDIIESSGDFRLMIVTVVAIGGLFYINWKSSKELVKMVSENSNDLVDRWKETYNSTVGEFERRLKLAEAACDRMRKELSDNQIAIQATNTELMNAKAQLQQEKLRSAELTSQAKQMTRILKRLEYEHIQDFEKFLS